MRHAMILFFLFSILSVFVVQGSAQITPHPTESKPLLTGDWPDPCILQDGKDYYMIHASRHFKPGTIIWHSKDLKTWRAITKISKNLPWPVWSPHLIKYGDTYYLYHSGDGNAVMKAPRIDGPWTNPIGVNLSGFDLCHATDENDKRYLYIYSGHVAPLDENGSSVIGPRKKVYTGWPDYPKDWITGIYALQCPRITWRNGWYYLMCAQNGTGGPSTGHMVITARSRNLLGPWENSPFNPIIRTWSRSEKYWLKGHGALVEGPDGRWYCVFHGTLNGQRSLGQSTLIEPIEWTPDGWCKVPDQWPDDWKDAVRIEIPMCDDFEGNELGIQWQFYDKLDQSRFRFRDGALEIDGADTTPGKSFPLCVIPQDAAYTIETEVEIEGNATAGMMLFYNTNAYLGMAIDPDGTTRRISKQVYSCPEHRQANSKRRRVAFRIVNNLQDVQCYRRDVGGEWVPLSSSIDIAHLNHNVLGDSSALYPSLFVTGYGRAKFYYFKYTPLGKSNLVDPNAKKLN